MRRCKVEFIRELNLVAGEFWLPRGELDYMRCFQLIGAHGKNEK